MKDKNMLRTLALTVAFSIISAIGANYSRAVIIEGFTASGQFVSVRVSEDGRLLIETSSGIAQSVFFASTQPVNSFQATTPWVTQFITSQAVNSFQGTSPWLVELNAAPQISTAATLSISTFAVNASAVEVLQADQSRKSSLVCNDSTLSAWFDFTVGVTTFAGKLLPAGACVSLDNPIAYVGALFINTTALVNIGVVEITP